jgi:hypothetical protein
MELNLQRRISGLKDKMPDIQKTLDTVRYLKTRTVQLPALLPKRLVSTVSLSRLCFDQDETEPIETTFELNDTLYAKASIPATDEVYLWLGVGLSHTGVLATHRNRKEG